MSTSPSRRWIQRSGLSEAKSNGTDIRLRTSLTTEKSPYCSGLSSGGAPTNQVAPSGETEPDAAPEAAGLATGVSSRNTVSDLEGAPFPFTQLTRQRPKACSVIFTPSQSPQTSAASRSTSASHSG